MKNKNRFSKWVWLVLVVAFAAIAGGGCLGSSSGGGGESSNVTEIDIPEHPLAAHLRELYDQMPEGTVFLSEKLSGAALAALKDRLMASYDDGKIIGMYAPTQARVEELREVLGVNDVKMGATDDEQVFEFFMIMKRNGIVFENEFHYAPGSADVTPPVPGDGSPIERPRTKADHYPEFAKKIAAWHDRVAELMKEERASRSSAAKELRTAASPYWTLSAISRPVHKTWNMQLGDVSTGYQTCYKASLIEMGIWIWSAYSYSTGCNIYLIKTSGSMNPGDNYYETTYGDRDQRLNATRSYTSWADMQDVSADKVSLLAHLPHNMNKATTYSSSFSVNLGGSVGGSIGGDIGGKFDLDMGIEGAIGTKTDGEISLNFIPGIDGHFNGSVNGSFSGGVAFSNSTSYEVYDWEAEDKTDVPGARPEVKYEFNYPDPDEGSYVSGGYLKLAPTSNISKSLFQSSESWVWAVDRSADSYKFRHHVMYEVGYVRGTQTVMHIPKRDGEFLPHQWPGQANTFSLPIPPTFGVTANQLIVNSNGRLEVGKEVTVGVHSTGKWKAECDVDWVELAETSGDNTGDEARRFIVDIKPNPDSHVRIGHITFTGPNDPNGKPQTAVIEVQQGAKK